MGFEAVDPLIADFVRYRKRRRPSERTAEEYARDLERLGRFLEKRPDDYRGPFEKLATATRLELLRYADALMDLKLSLATVRRRLSAVKSFYNYLFKEFRREDNPAASLDLPFLEERLPKPLPEEALAKLLRTTLAGQSDFHRLRNRAMFELLYAAGLRRAELIGINLEDVDFEKRLIRVVGKGNKERMVVFNSAASDAMQLYLGHRPRTDDPAFFVTHDGRRISHSHVGKIFKVYTRLAQIGKATPHMLRHSFATHLISHGADILTVQMLLGHKSPVTTKQYIKITLEQAKEVYDRTHPRDKRDDR